MIPGAAGVEGLQPIVQVSQVEQTPPADASWQGHAPTVAVSAPVEDESELAARAAGNGA